MASSIPNTSSLGSEGRIMQTEVRINYNLCVQTEGL